MRAKRIIIKNYRSFDGEGEEVIFPEINHPISIVGNNNSGKTNFLRALLLGFGVKPTFNCFDENDFYNKQIDKKIEIEIETYPPLRCSDIYSTIKEMPIIRLVVEEEGGIFTNTHQFHSIDGKPIFNVGALKRGKNKVFSEEDTELLNQQLKKGIETVKKWQSKIPVYFIEPSTIHNQLKANKNTILGKLIIELKKDFERKENTVIGKEGVVPRHVGQPRSDVFKAALEYLEKFIITTPKVDEVIEQIEKVVKSQLDLSADNFQLLFGLPTIDAFYDSLTFYIKDHPDKPKLPLANLGNGFSSLFIVALLRALVDADKGGNIFVVEEPETYLHEHFQEYFFDVLKELSKKNQVIITTHSKKFVNLFIPESIIRFKNDRNLKTKVIQRTKPEVQFPERIGDFVLHSVNDFALYLKSLEPNLNNLIFSSKVLIVEGPHDLLGYNTLFSKKYNLSFNNIAILAAWGKDTIKTLVQLCQRFEVPYFVIHDWDLALDDITIMEPAKSAVYKELTQKEKAQYTKNYQILSLAGTEKVHQNKSNLETVLNIQTKGTVSVYNNLISKTFDEIIKAYPKFTSPSLLDFIEM